MILLIFRLKSIIIEWLLLLFAPVYGFLAMTSPNPNFLGKVASGIFRSHSKILDCFFPLRETLNFKGAIENIHSPHWSLSILAGIIVFLTLVLVRRILRFFRNKGRGSWADNTIERYLSQKFWPNGVEARDICPTLKQ